MIEHFTPSPGILRTATATKFPVKMEFPAGQIDLFVFKN